MKDELFAKLFVNNSTLNACLFLLLLFLTELLKWQMEQTDFPCPEKAANFFRFIIFCIYLSLLTLYISEIIYGGSTPYYIKPSPFHLENFSHAFGRLCLFYEYFHWLSSNEPAFIIPQLITCLKKESWTNSQRATVSFETLSCFYVLLHLEPVD